MACKKFPICIPDLFLEQKDEAEIYRALTMLLSEVTYKIDKTGVDLWREEFVPLIFRPLITQTELQNNGTNLYRHLNCARVPKKLP